MNRSPNCGAALAPEPCEHHPWTRLGLRYPAQPGAPPSPPSLSPYATPPYLDRPPSPPPSPHLVLLPAVEAPCEVGVGHCVGVQAPERVRQPRLRQQQPPERLALLLRQRTRRSGVMGGGVTSGGLVTAGQDRWDRARQIRKGTEGPCCQACCFRFSTCATALGQCLHVTFRNPRPLPLTGVKPALLRLVLGACMSISLCAQLRSPVTTTGLPRACRPCRKAAKAPSQRPTR